MKNFLKGMYSACIRVLLLPVRLLPLRNDRVVFTGLTGGASYEYSCNPKYVCEYLYHHVPGRFKLCWVVHRPEEYAGREHKEILFCRHYSLKAYYWLLTSKVVVTGGSYAPWFPFRKKQYLINTWHGGGAYKKIESDTAASGGWAEKRRIQFCAKNISLFVSSCQKATELLFRGAFQYSGEVMEVGMPRNDRLVSQDTKDYEKTVRERCGIGADERIILYAPTYRSPSSEVVLDADRLLELLEEGGESWRFLYRPHRYQTEQMKLEVKGKRVIDVRGYPDMQELLGAADVLITDYSSAVWDYSFLFRPCFLYVPDLEEYLNQTGFYVDIRDWPFEMALNQQELEEKMREYDPHKAREKIKQHHQYMGSRESGDACRCVAERILDVCKEKL